MRHNNKILYYSIIKFQQHLQHLSEMEDNFHNIWQGEAADIYLARLRRLHSAMERTAQEMSEYNLAVRECTKDLLHNNK